ncbi:MAG: cysteine--tRNA ligase [Ignavibacteriaceae bacterium]
MLTLYNTLTKKKEEFKPLNPPNVSMYVCGPTVYDFFHIGNARSFIAADIIRRYLIYKGYKVKFVMNITDIDDKIIKRSLEEKRSFEQVSADYTSAFLQDLRALKIMEADVYPKATVHMDDIISMIKTLVEKEFAYEINGNVFYDVHKFKEYGKLSGKDITRLEAGSRVEVNEEKRNPLDFTLWKKAKENEPAWDSPWGKGRPGWHIECSAMSCKHLGESFDIHAGGNDLIFPHHENEIAQSEAASGKPFAKYWIHFGFLNINEEKMSKSLGNFFTAREVLKKYPAEAIRLFFAQAYYRGPLNFSDELLNAAKKGIEKLNNLVNNLNEALSASKKNGVYPDINIRKFYSDFESAMDDDFNTAQAAASVFDFVREVNTIIARNDEISQDFYNDVKTALQKTAGDVLGIIDFSSSQAPDGKLENDLIELLIDLRREAKQNKNYALADNIRDRLKGLGIILEDKKDRTVYKKNISD